MTARAVATGRPARATHARATHARAPHVGPRARRPRGGFTLVEIVFAILLLAIGLLAIAGLGIAASQTTRRGSIQTVAAAIAQSRFDSLASVPCRTLANGGATAGTSTFRGVRERWSVTNDGTSMIIKRLSDSLWVPGRSRPLVYLSVIPCR